MYMCMFITRSPGGNFCYLHLDCFHSPTPFLYNMYASYFQKNIEFTFSSFLTEEKMAESLSLSRDDKRSLSFHFHSREEGRTSTAVKCCRMMWLFQMSIRL